jgi:hypothetical protein
VPYSPVNIKDIYARGGTLSDAWANPFFADIRNWQTGYMQSQGNWLAPCLNRDHHGVLTQLIAKHEPEPIDESAREALLDPDYGKELERYGELYDEISAPIWRDHYLNGQPQKDRHDEKS